MPSDTLDPMMGPPLTATAQFISDFADQAVVLPSALVVALVLLMMRRWRNAALWLLLVTGSFGLILALKLACRACGSPLPDHLLLSPSGHTMAATVLYGGLLVLAGARTRLAVASAFAIALLIGMTRLALHAHTVPEVLVGGMIGLVAVACFSRLAERPSHDHHAAARGAGRWLPIALALLPVLVLHGQRSGIESSIHRIAIRYVGEWLGCSRYEAVATPQFLTLGAPQQLTGPAGAADPAYARTAAFSLPAASIR